MNQIKYQLSANNCPFVIHSRAYLSQCPFHHSHSCNDDSLTAADGRKAFCKLTLTILQQKAGSDISSPCFIANILKLERYSLDTVLIIDYPAVANAGESVIKP